MGILERLENFLETRARVHPRLIAYYFFMGLVFIVGSYWRLGEDPLYLVTFVLGFPILVLTILNFSFGIERREGEPQRVTDILGLVSFLMLFVICAVILYAEYINLLLFYRTVIIVGLILVSIGITFAAMLAPAPKTRGGKGQKAGI